MDTLLQKFARVDSKGRTLLTPFVVSKSRKVLYLHIGKTGGSTVTKVFRENKLDDYILTNKKLRFARKKEYFEDLVNNWQDYFKFTFIRNKYSLLYSLWRYDNREFDVDFASFISDLVLPSEDTYGYWIDQYYLTTQNGDPIFDFIGHTENFDSDFEVVCDRLGLKVTTPGERINVGPYDHKVHYSNFYTTDIEQKVYGKFKKEIDYFGFNIENDIS